jgi:hypothetical protein
VRTTLVILFANVHFELSKVKARIALIASAALSGGVLELCCIISLGGAWAEVPLDRFIESIVPLRLCICARLCSAIGVAAHAKTLSCSNGLGGRGQVRWGEVGRAAHH